MTTWPAIVLVIFCSLDVAIWLTHWGKPRIGNYGFAQFISLGIRIWILHAGNFFAPIGWPA